MYWSVSMYLGKETAIYHHPEPQNDIKRRSKSQRNYWCHAGTLNCEYRSRPIDNGTGHSLPSRVTVIDAFTQLELYPIRVYLKKILFSCFAMSIIFLATVDLYMSSHLFVSLYLRMHRQILGSDFAIMFWLFGNGNSIMQRQLKDLIEWHIAPFSQSEGVSRFRPWIAVLYQYALNFPHWNRTLGETFRNLYLWKPRNSNRWWDHKRDS